VAVQGAGQGGFGVAGGHPDGVGDLCVGTALFGMFFFLTVFLQEVWGYSPLRTGIAYLPMVLTIMVASGIASQLVARIGARPLMLAGSGTRPASTRPSGSCAKACSASARGCRRRQVAMWRASLTRSEKVLEQSGGVDACGEAEKSLRQFVGGFHGGVVADAVE